MNDSSEWSSRFNHNSQTNYTGDISNESIKKIFHPIKNGVRLLIWGKYAWEVKQSSYGDSFNDIITQDHLFKAVIKKYRWKWYWTQLMQEYINIWHILPPYEYTMKYEVIKLLEKFWYEIFSYFQNWEEYVVEDKLPAFLDKKDCPPWITIKLKKIT